MKKMVSMSLQFDCFIYGRKQFAQRKWNKWFKLGENYDATTELVEKILTPRQTFWNSFIFRPHYKWQNNYKRWEFALPKYKPKLVILRLSFSCMFGSLRMGFSKAIRLHQEKYGAREEGWWTTVKCRFSI